MSDEYMKEVGDAMLAQLSKSKPSSEPLSRGSEPQTSWGSDATPKPAHPLWDDELDTKKFVRIAPEDKTERMELSSPEATPGLSLWDRFKRLMGRLF